MIWENFKNGFLLGVFALASLSPSWVHAMTFDSIVVFGGSVSDSGNFFALTGITNRPPYDKVDDLLVPTGPYTKGGNHFSNGDTWIEQYAKPRGLTSSVNPAFRGSSQKATNYAVGGARARDVGFKYMAEQVKEFLNDFKSMAPSDALYVIDFGGNDVRDALTAADPLTLLGEALNAIGSNMGLLYAAGARRFLVLNVADIGQIPSIRILDENLKADGKVMQFATLLSEGFNAGLDGFLAALRLALPDIDIAQLDVFGTVNALIEHPEEYGLTEVEIACITPDVPPFSCQKPDKFLFWDGVHPTKAVHAIFAEEAAAVLEK